MEYKSMEFGSFLACILTIATAYLVFYVSMNYSDKGYKFLGFGLAALSVSLGLYGIFGMIAPIDLWSVGRRLL